MSSNKIDFFKEVLNKKLSFIIQTKGGFYKPPSDVILNNLELGCYELDWRNTYCYDTNMFYHEIKYFKKLKSNTYKINSGKIIINGRHLNSSQFIEFSLEDLRDYKINNLLSS